jgi:hypothetical protein
LPSARLPSLAITSSSPREIIILIANYHKNPTSYPVIMSSIRRQPHHRGKSHEVAVWKEEPSSKDELIRYMQNMYWAGVKHELSLILLTLKEWRKRKYDESKIDGEDDLHVSGYDTFIDQVNEGSRKFAERYC